jgi:hypothetical protein
LKTFPSKSNGQKHAVDMVSQAHFKRKLKLGTYTCESSTFMCITDMRVVTLYKKLNSGELHDDCFLKVNNTYLHFPRLKKFLVERRNYRVATQLLEKYTDDVQLGDLRIFCVSNKEYFEHRYDDQAWAEPRLALSGIVNLRKYCHSIPAEAQFAAASAFIENDVPAFIGSLRQWAVGGMDEVGQEKAQELQQLVNDIEMDAIKVLIPVYIFDLRVLMLYRNSSFQRLKFKSRDKI